MVLEKVASSLLSFFLTKYIDKVNTNALKMSLFSGTVSLDNLSVKKAALMQHKLPFKIVRGTVDRIFVSIPYIHFKSKPTQAGINNILVLGKLSEKTIIESEQLSTKDTDIPEEFNKIDSALKDKKVSTFDFTAGIVGAIIENLQVKITNIHVRLEYDLEGNTIAIGLIVPLIQVMSIDENGKEINTNNSKTMIRKKLILSNLSLYLDTKSEHYKQKAKNENIDFKQLMLDSMKSDSHQFILHNFTFETVYEHAKSGQGPITIRNILKATTSAIKLAIDSYQYRCFMLILSQHSRYMIKKFYSTCGKPNVYPCDEADNDDCILWWMFAERCSEKKNKPFNFNPTTALIFLKNRNKNLAKLSDILLNPNKKKDEKYLKGLQEQYGGDVFLMFRAYAKFRTEKDLREKKHKEMEEMRKKNKNEIAQESKEIQELLSSKDIIKNNADTWLVEYKVSAINLGLLYTPTTYLAMLNWKAWQGAFKKNKDDIEFEALIGDMNIVNMMSKERTKIVELIKSEKAKGGSATVNIAGNLASRIFKIDSLITSPHLFSDLTIVNEVQMFLSGSAGIHVGGSVPKIHKRDHTHAETVNLIETHSKLFINLHLDSPVVTFPYTMPIEILLGNVDIKSINPDRKRSIHKKETWYDEYSLDLTGFQILMGKKKFCKPVTFSLNCLRSFIRRSSMVMIIAKTKISSMTFDVTKKQYRKILELPDYIKQYVKPPKKNEEELEHKKEETQVVKKKKSTNKKTDSIVSDLSVQLNVDFEELGLRLFKSKNVVGSELKIAGISTGVKALEEKADGTFVLQYIKVLGNTDKCICNFGDEKIPAINVEVHIQGIEIDLSMHTSKPIIDVDFDWLGSLLRFVIIPQASNKAIENQPPKDIEKKHHDDSKLEKEKHKDVNDYQLLRRLEQYPIYKIEVVFAGPIVNLPCGNTKIIIDLDLLHIYTKDPIPRDPSNIDSFYDKLTCEFSKLEIHLGDEFLLEPFSFDIEADKAFVRRSNVESLKIFMDIHELKLHIKRSQFLSLLNVVDSVKDIIPSSDSNKDEDDSDEEPTPELESHKKSSGTKIPKSMYVNLKFRALIVELLNENNSLHTGFHMDNLESSFNSFQEDINGDFKIVVLKGVYNDNTLLRFGENNVPSFNFKIHNNKDETNVDLYISKPTIFIDFQWIAQLKRFFEMPKKIISRERILELTDSSKDSTISRSEVSKSERQESDTQKDSNSNLSNIMIQSQIESKDKEDKDKKASREDSENGQEEEDKKEKAKSEENNKDSQFKNRGVSIDIFNHASSDKIENQNNYDKEQEQPEQENKEIDDEKETNESEVNEQIQNTLIKEKSSSNASLNQTENSEPIVTVSTKLKMHPIVKTLKILALFIPFLLFHSFFFRHKFLSILFLSAEATASYFVSKKLDKKEASQEETIETPIIEPQNEEPIEEPKVEQEENSMEEHEEKLEGEPDDKIKDTKTRAVDLLTANVIKAPEEESIEEPPKKPLTLFEQIQKIRGKFVITEPSFTVILVKRTKESIRMNTLIKKLHMEIDQNQIGFFCINDFHISMDDRYLMKSFSINIGLDFQTTISAKINLSAIVLDLQICDYQVLLELGKYIPAVLNANKQKNAEIATCEDMMSEITASESQVTEATDSQSVQSQQQVLYENQKEEEEVNENKKPKLPVELDVDFKQIELNLFKNEKKLFNFDINSIMAQSNVKGELDLEISSIICEEHISSKTNTIISFSTPTLAKINDTGDVSVSISPDATVFVKMEEINALLSIFLPGEQILDYEKQNKIKHKHENKKKHKHKHIHIDKHKHKHKKKHDQEKKEKHKSKIKMISVKSQCFKVVFLDDSEIATLQLTKISYVKIGDDQTIKVFDIALTDPVESNLYPPQVLSSEKGKALSLELRKKETSIKINRLIVFANLKVIRRVVNTVVKNPLKLPPPPAEEEDEDEESQDSKNQEMETSKVEEIKEESDNEKEKQVKKDKDDDNDKQTSGKNENVDNKLIVKKNDHNVDKNNSDIDENEEKENSEKQKKKNKSSKLKLRFKYINFTVPVSFNESDEMFDFSIDGYLSISSKMKLSVHQISAKFIQYKGLEHPPFIQNISLDLIKKENDMKIKIKPTLISVALDDIAAAGVLAGSLNKFASHLNIPHDDGFKKEKKKKDKKDTDNKMQDFSLSVDLNKLQIILNCDRYQTVPLFRLIFEKFAISYANLKPSSVHCVFDSIDFMDIHNLTWKMLLEKFSLNIALLITEDLVSVDTTIEDPININCAYQAIQLILSHLKIISDKVSAKQLTASKPPTFKVVNRCSKNISIKKVEAEETFDVDSCTEKIFDFTRDDELEIKIGYDSRTIVTSKLRYPIFIDFQAVSQDLQESGTTLLISSILLFQNQTRLDLILFQQKNIMSFEKVFPLPPGKQIPFTDLESLKTTNFAITTEESAVKSNHSTFKISELKRRSILLNCILPNKRKLKLVVFSKFDSLTCSMIVKIQPNCIIHNQLPLELYIRSDEKDENEILHLKPGEAAKTTTIDTSGLEFNAYFATSSFGENADELNVTNDNLKHKVNIKTIDGFISSVPLNPVNPPADEKPFRICFAIEAKKNATKPQFELVCFAPSIIFNLTGIEINCYNKVRDKKKIITEKFSPREKGSDPDKDGCLIWSSDEYFKRKDTSRKLSLQISTTAESEMKYCYENVDIDKENLKDESDTNYMGDDVIECLATHINGPIMLPTRKEGIFIPLHYTVASAQPISSSTLVTITSQYAIRNDTSSPFYLQPVILPKQPKSKAKKVEEIGENKKTKDKKSHKGQEIASVETESENPSKNKKKHLFKSHKKDEGDNDTDTETTATTNEDPSTMKKKSKKKHFHLKSHKDTHAKTDTEDQTDNDSEKETKTDEESTTAKKKSKNKHFHIKVHKDSHAKTDIEDQKGDNSDTETETQTKADGESTTAKKKNKKKHFHLKTHKQSRAKTDVELEPDYLTENDESITATTENQAEKKSKKNLFHFKKHKETKAKADDDNDNEANDKNKAGKEAEHDEESITAKKKDKKKLFTLKKYKDTHAKTDTDNETDNENEPAPDEESTAAKKNKKKHFHFKSHKETKAKTDVDMEPDYLTDNNEDESTTAAENQSKKKKSRKLHLKKNTKKNKKSEDDATSDLESTTMNDNDDDEEETSIIQSKKEAAAAARELEKSFKFGDVITVENTGKNQQILLASEGLLFAFKTDPKSSKYTLLNFSEPIHTTFAYEGLLFEIENETIGAESLIIIKEAVFPQPINLLNDLRLGSHDVYLTQKGANKDDNSWKSVANPQSMSIVAYDIPFGGTDLVLHYKKHHFSINLIRVNTPKKKHHIYYEVIVNKNNTKTIVVSKIPYQHPKKTNVSLHLNIPVISVSLIDKLNREIALLTLQRLEFGFEIGKLNKIMFNLGAFQLDDLQPSAMLKVVIAAYPDVLEGEDLKSKNLLEFSTSMFADTPFFTACKELSLKCDPIILFIDLSFLSDVITLMQTMFLVEQSNKSVLLSKPNPARSSSLSSAPLTAESLTINEIKFTIFVRAHSSRPNLYKSVSYFLRAVPDITNGAIVLPSFHFEDCTMNAAYIQKEIVRPLIDAGIKQGLKLLFNTDIFMRSTGTKSASFAKKGEKLMNGQLQVLVQVPGSMILQGGEAGLNVASKFLHNISFSKGTSVNRVNATAKDTMNSGVKALGHGFADAFTGLVKDSMNEKDKKGVGGVFIGIGKGLLGLVTKPIAGVLDASVASISAMRKAMNGEDADVIPPIRIAHALPMIELANYTDQMIVSKDIAQLSFQMSDIQVLYDQYVELYVIDDETSDWLGIAQEFFFTADKDGKLLKKSRIKSITDINWDKDTRIITMNVNEIAIKSYEIHVNEKDRAIRITEMINSRRIALGIGE